MNQSTTNWSNEKLEREIRRHPNNSCLWNELFIRLKPQLFPRAMRTCNGNVHDAEEIVQDVFLALLEKKLSDIRNSLIAYVHGIMRNKCNKWIKDQQGKLLGFDRGDEGDDEIQSEQLDPSNQVVHDEVFNVIKAFFKRKSIHWAIIRLNMFDKLSHTKIAVQLGISEGASRARLHKALTALRKLCDKHNITSEELKRAFR